MEATPNPPLFTLDTDSVCDVERQWCGEFFLGRANKTPERYIMIRNYIVTAWQEMQPQYLTKIRARAGLKNCGDVNAIGRIHAFLEHAGIINAGANRRKSKETGGRRRMRKEEEEEESDSDGKWSARKMPTANGRRRRVRDEHGNWVFEDEYYGGHVISHDVVERHADDADYSCSASSDNEDQGSRKKKRKRINGGSRYQVQGEFRLVPCRVFSEGGDPFGVEISAAALALMDLNAHLMDTEVIGLLGGAYDASRRVVRVDVAFPCNSSSSSATECEMDPKSEVDARRVFAQQSRHVVGWFHSHPTFDAVPSVRDIHNQLAYQSLCRRPADRVEPFVGVIVSPTTGASDISVFYVVPNEGGGVPYQLAFDVIGRSEVPEGSVDDMARLVEVHAGLEHRADLARRVRRSDHITRLERLVASVRGHWADDVTARWDDQVAMRLLPLLQRHYCRSGSGSGSHTSEPVAAARDESESTSE
ncbi:hypothetical protein GGI20_002236 [Coemansia sp. BCRC 34301]|nr:hypothetical protein GGI20_002236 [Coemansia sp. BCRC 34301]